MCSEAHVDAFFCSCLPSIPFKKILIVELTEWDLNLTYFVVDSICEPLVWGSNLTPGIDIFNQLCVVMAHRLSY